MSEEELINLALRIQEKQDCGESIEEELSLFEKNVPLEGARDLFFADYKVEYIVKRSLYHKDIERNTFSKNELIKMLEIIINLECEDWELSILLDLITQSTGCKKIYSLIYFSSEDVTPESIVDKIYSEEIINE